MFLHKWHTRAIVLSVMISLLTACTAGATQETSTLLSSTETAMPESITTTTPGPTHTPSLTPTVLPPPLSEPLGTSIEPAVVAPRIFPNSWSPDNEWLAYWTFTKQEVSVDYSLPPGTLNFLNSHTNQTCRSPYPVGYPYLQTHALFWSPDGKALFFVNGRLIEGTPCHDDFSDITGRFPKGIATIAAASPDYRILLLVTNGDHPSYMLYEPEMQIRRVLKDTVGGSYAWSPSRTRIGFIGDINCCQNYRAGAWVVDVKTGAVQQLATWLYQPAEGNFPDPTWLGDDQLLVYGSLDQGPLLIGIDQRKIKSIAELLDAKLNPSCSKQTPCDELMATGALVEGTQTYHIALFTIRSGNDLRPPLPGLLYHSETGEVEQFPIWATPQFSPNGLWLAAQVSASDDTPQIWLRPVDPVGSKWRLLSNTDVRPVWSPDSASLAIDTHNGISIFSLSHGDWAGIWTMEGYTPVNSGLWSPDGKFLAARTRSIDGEGLFVIDAR